MLTRQLRANGGEHWPCRFFEAGGTASVQRWKQYMQWAEGILGQDDIPAACATAIRVFDLFAHCLDQAAQNLQARA
jgi:heme oxygenase